MSCVIAITSEPLEGESYDILLAAVIPVERLGTIYDDMDDILQIAGDEEELDTFLSQIRARKVACGHYLLSRDVVLHSSEEAVSRLMEKWHTMVSDGILVQL